ncbi:MAG: hypothetical protein OEV24_15950 [Cyclobacteriaceae bacterium]|nr:hypothetical protein [Cyclobacteriaceae bacterium]
MKLFKHKYLLFILLSSFLAVGLFLWIKSDNDLKDFGLNFVTEILGVVITVFIIDGLAQIREFERTKPLKLAEFEDAKNLFNRFISFWYVAYSRSVPAEYPETFDEFLSDKGIGRIFDYLDIGSKPSQNDSLSWTQWIQDNHDEWLAISNRYLERHSANADPELYKLIHAFVECPIMKTIPMMNAFTKVREKNDSHRSNALSGYLPKPKKTDYEVLQKMNQCLKSLNKKYYPDKSKSDNITNYKPVKLVNRKVDCALAKEDFIPVERLQKE